MRYFIYEPHAGHRHVFDSPQAALRYANPRGSGRGSGVQNA